MLHNQSLFCLAEVCMMGIGSEGSTFNETPWSKTNIIDHDVQGEQLSVKLGTFVFSKYLNLNKLIVSLMLTVLFIGSWSKISMHRFTCLPRRVMYNI